MKDEECNDDERIGKPVSENLVILPWGRQVKKFWEGQLMIIRDTGQTVV